MVADSEFSVLHTPRLMLRRFTVADLDAFVAYRAEPEVARYEPKQALDGGVDGMTLIRELLMSIPDFLTPDGIALLEIGENQACPLQHFVAERLPEFHAAAGRDLAGAERFLILEPAHR